MDHKTHRTVHRIEGMPAAPGIALGRLLRLVATKLEVRQARSSASEEKALADALEASRLDLSALAGKVGNDDAEAILSFQIALLEDANLVTPGLCAYCPR